MGKIQYRLTQRARNKANYNRKNRAVEPSVRISNALFRAEHYGDLLEDGRGIIDCDGMLTDSYSFEEDEISILQRRQRMSSVLGEASATAEHVGNVDFGLYTPDRDIWVPILNSRTELPDNLSDRSAATIGLSNFNENDTNIIMPQADNNSNKMYLTFNRSMESSLEEVYNVTFGHNIRFRAVRNFIRFNIEGYWNALTDLLKDSKWKVISQNQVSSLYNLDDYQEYPDLSQWAFRQTFLVNEDYPDLLLDFSADLSKAQVFVISHLEQADQFKEILELMDGILVKYEKEKKVIEEQGRINIITQNSGGFQLRSITIESIKDEDFIDDNYNDDFATFHNMITNDFENKKSGLFLLHGDPGTGKTNYIRYLISQNASKKKIIYIPPEMAHHIASPNFINFMIDNSDSILVLEDAENVLLKRQAGDGQAVANLLNLTDGLLGTLMKCLVVCTFNCPETSLDEALLRKGRLLGKYKFEKLKAAKANALLQKKFNLTTSKDMTLAEIYNLEAANDFAYKAPKSSFGFHVV